jgi:hypothetical protein
MSVRIAGVQQRFKVGTLIITTTCYVPVFRQVPITLIFRRFGFRSGECVECHLLGSVPYNLTDVNRRFGGTYCLHFHRIRLSQTFWYFLGLLFYLEDGGK